MSSTGPKGTVSGPEAVIHTMHRTYYDDYCLYSIKSRNNRREGDPP